MRGFTGRLGERGAHLFLVVFLSQWILPPGSLAGQKDENDTIRFAESLFVDRDYYRAITEYKRFLFEFPGSPIVPWVRFRIGESYFSGGQTEAARMVFEDVRGSVLDPTIRLWASLAVAHAFYSEGRLQQSLTGLDALIPALHDESMKGTALYLKGCVLLKTGEPIQAEKTFSTIWAGHPLAERASFLALAASETANLPHKSPWVAGFLSIVPGLGHVYLEEAGIAVTAFLWNGLFGFAAVDTFRRGQLGAGSLLAALELLWYSGTVYGAVSGAQQYNRDAEQNALDALNRRVGLDVDFPDPGAVSQILLQGRF
jgi:hypothetical protein